MRDAVFDEEVMWRWGDEEPTNEFIIDYVSMVHPETVIVHHGMPDTLPDQGMPPPSPDVGAESPALTSTPSSTMDTDHDDAPIRYWSIQDIMDAMTLEDPAQGSKVRICCWLTAMSWYHFKMPRRLATGARRCSM
jgi:hypothetical protein